MPIYEYQCRACQHELEALQKVSDPHLTDCPNCQQPSLQKKISAAGFRLKGGGWYETDFKSGNRKNIAGGGDSGAGTAAKTDSGSASSGTGSPASSTA